MDLNNLRRDVAKGPFCTHSRLNTTSGKTLEARSFLCALVELLGGMDDILIEALAVQVGAAGSGP